MKISISRNILDNYSTDKNLSKEQLVELLTSYPSEILTKKTAPAFIAGHFNGTQRITENLQSRTLITLDLDHCNHHLNDLEGVLEETLHMYGYCAYSTSSHTPDKPKIRIVLFLQKEVAVEEYKNITTNFINSLSKIKPFIDITSSTVAAQLMFLPFRSSEKYQQWSKTNNGTTIDPSLFLNEIKLELNSKLDDFDKTVKSTPLNITKNEVIAYLKLYPERSCNYDEWLEVGECLHHQFVGSDEGKDIWYQWSLKHKKSEDNINNINYKWTTFKTDRDKVKTFASIINRAKSYREEKSIGNESVKLICKSKWVQTKGKSLSPLSGEDNFQVLFDEYNIKINYDEILKDVNVYKGNYLFDDENSALTSIKLLCEINGLKSSLANEVMKLFAGKNVINSWRDLVLSHSSNKTDNFDKLCNTIKVEPEYEDLKRLYLKKWLLQMIHMTCLNDGERPKAARMVLVFQGKQGIGKTSWFRSLAPKGYSKYVLEGHTLNVNDFMNVTTCLKHVFVELGELAATFRKSDTEQLKSFISNTMDELNKKYSVHPVKYRRKTVFFGSVNDENFLQDQTGNSRFLVLPVLDCDARHNINMFDLYAELLEEAKLDDSYDLTDDELQTQAFVNNKFENINTLKEKFEEKFDITKEEQDVLYTATKTLEILGFNITNIRKNHTNDMASLLKKYGFKRSPKYRTWYLPPLRFNMNEDIM